MLAGVGIPVYRGSCLPALQSRSVDWEGEALDPPVEFGFLLDGGFLKFHARRRAAATCHPEARTGRFQEELWKYDVVEFFLSHPDNGSYLEVNLAPNGAWWTCLFRAPREQWESGSDEIRGVESEGEVTAGSWSATLGIPLASLEKTPVGFGEGWGLNVTLIFGFPESRYLSAAPLGPGSPDFHQPAKFPPLVIRS